jgi:hypothetical protein
MNRRWFFLLALALCFFAAGCNTYLGYHFENVTPISSSEELVRTSPPQEIRIEVLHRPASEDPSLVVKATALYEKEFEKATEVTATKKEKYLEYNFGFKLAEMIMGIPLSLIGGPFDLVEKLFGGYRLAGLQYDNIPPPYFTRLSQNGLTGFVNPFQRCLGDKDTSFREILGFRTVLHAKEKRQSWDVLPDHPLRVFAPRLGYPSLNTATDANGQARVDLAPWVPFLEPHKNLEILVSAAKAKARAEEKLVCSSDDLLSAKMITQAEEKKGQKTNQEKPKEPIAPPTPPQLKPTPPPSSPPAEKPQPKPPPAPDYARLQAVRRVALVIGIDKYEYYPALRSAVGDARGVAAVLRSSYGFSDVRELLDAEATRAGILEAVENLAVAAKKGDSVLLFFAGHGEYSEPLARGAWVPADAQSGADFIPNSAIHDFVKAMDARGAGHVLVIADACFSGAFLEVTRSADRGLGVRPATAAGAELPRWLEKLAASPSHRALTSGSIEPVADSGGGGHSPFTRCLLEALRNPEHDAFTATELAARVQRLVGLNSEQTPRYGVIRFAGDMAGEFVFVKSGR